MSSPSSPTPTESLALVRALAEGRQPFTGAPLEAPDWLLDPRLQAALRLLLAGTHETPPTQPARQGKVWPPAEQSDLLDAWADGASIEQLAAHHQRSTGAIRARLVRVGVEEQLGEPADRSFLQSFHTLALVPQGWHHRALLRVIWTLLLDHTVQETVDQLRVGLQALARHFELPQDLPPDLPPDRRSGHHETLTVAWVRVVAGRIRSVGRSTHFHAFVDTHPDLLDPTYLRRHYSHARAMSEDARSYFLPADREPLPPARDP